MFGDYTKEDLLLDLNLLIKHELIEHQLNDEGEWVYRITEKAKAMSDEEVAELIHNMDISGRDNA